MSGVKMIVSTSALVGLVLAFIGAAAYASGDISGEGAGGLIGAGLISLCIGAVVVMVMDDF